MLEAPPIDAIPVSGWTLEIDPGDSGVEVMASPHFHKLSGLSKETGLLEVIDGASNRVYNFTDALIRFSDIVITRTRDGSADDGIFASYFDQLVGTGLKVAGATAVQWRLGQKVMEIDIATPTFFKYELADMDTEGSGTKSDQSYTLRPDNWSDIHYAIH